jgi:hypothetical protein
MRSYIELFWNDGNEPIFSLWDERTDDKHLLCASHDEAVVTRFVVTSPLSTERQKQTALQMLEAEQTEMDDDLTVTFSNDVKVLGVPVYLDPKLFYEYIEAKSVSKQEFQKHLDDLLETCKRDELSQYPFLSFTEPADYHQRQYWVVRLGEAHVEARREAELSRSWRTR